METGSVTLFHTKQITQIYTKFNVHRGAIKFMKYLPKSKLFLTVCDQKVFKLWRQNLKERKIDVIFERYIARTIVGIEMIVHD